MNSILLVDDDLDFRAMQRLVLERRGYAVKEATDGRAALAQLRQRKFDLVIMEIVMPEMEGIETIRRIREQDPDLAIIAVSGGSPYTRADLNLLVARRMGANQEDLMTLIQETTTSS